jgi:threonine/homoserine/homoserine lactone efflux protein
MTETRTMTIHPAVVSLVFVAAITPGPNNLVVLRLAAIRGWPATLPAICAIVTGSVALLAATHAGVGVVFATERRLRAVIAILGAVYLVWLGVTTAVSRRGASSSAIAPENQSQVRATLSIFWFQFLNPKGWVMVLTATSASATSESWNLAIVFSLVPAACLTVWATLGIALSRALNRTTTALWFDRAMGTALVASAIALVAGY